MSSAPALPIEDLFLLYAKNVPAETIALRLEQLFTNIPAGAFKNTARNTLMSDLVTALQAQIDLYETQYVAPVASDLADVNDTTLP